MEKEMTNRKEKRPGGEVRSPLEMWNRHVHNRVRRGRTRSLSARIMVWLALLGVSQVLTTCLAVGLDTSLDYMLTVNRIAFDNVKTAAELIDGDRIAHYAQTLEKDDYYHAIQAFLDASQLNSKNINYYYVFIPHEDEYFFIWDAKNAENTCDLGETEPYEEGDKEAIELAFRKDPVERIYRSQYNEKERLVSALYPIFNSQGDPVALVGVDMGGLSLLQSLGGSLLNVALSVLLVISVFMILAFLMIRKKVTQPIKRLKQGMQLYRKSMDSVAATEALEGMPLESEIGALAGDFIVLMVDVDSNTEEVAQLTAERERIGTELKVATGIQTSMLPRVFPAFPERKEFDLYASMTPAKEVGGDFYDFFLVDDDHLALVMADVSGKGVPAALFMAVSRTLIKTRTLTGGTPGQILRDVNNQLAEDNKNGMFVTVWLAILELSTGRGLAANAGHEHPVLRRAGGSYELVEYRHSPVVAFMKGIPFREREFRLNPGDRLFVYTDGVPEAQNSTPELYETERMLSTLNEAGELSPEETLAALKRSIEAFEDGADQFDDITMLCLDYFGPEAER